MAKIIYGDIFEQDVDALVNPVNCEGVMGAGLARQFRQRYPDMYEMYKEICESGLRYYPGDYMGYYIKEEGIWIFNVATKYKWRDSSKIEYVDAGVRNIATLLRNQWKEERPIKSIAIPALGCGLGGLDWDDVRPIMKKRLQSNKVAEAEVIIVINDRSMALK